MTETQALTDFNAASTAALADKYVALWNETDPARRRQLVAELWTEDGRYILQPPEEIRAIAAQPGIGMAAVLQVRGHEQIAARAGIAVDHWVGAEGCTFRRRDDADRVEDMVKLTWEAIDREGAVFAVGLNVLLLAADGRIERDYGFIVG